MYTTVSIMKMNACRITIRMWNSPHPTPSAVETTSETTPPTELQNPPVSVAWAAHNHSSRKMISPAYILPNNRNECDSGFETYSMRLNSRLKTSSNGEAHNGLMPKGAQASSWSQPPS